MLGKEAPHHDAAAHLLIQLDGSHEEAVDADFEVVGELCLDNGARDVLVARDRHTRDRLWETRRMIIESLNHESPVNHMEDVVVPRAALPALLKGIKQLAAQHDVRIVCFGHAGDGNVHINVLKDDIPEARWESLVPVVARSIYELALPLGGTITGEHGIGYTRRQYLAMDLEPAQIDILARIKRAFDPNLVLNPGKVIP